jgi:hypothetical protein
MCLQKEKHACEIIMDLREKKSHSNNYMRYKKENFNIIIPRDRGFSYIKHAVKYINSTYV